MNSFRSFLVARLCPTTRWQWSVFLVSVGVLAAGAAATGWWLHRPVPAAPPLPPDIPDVEVRKAVQHAYQEVMESPSDAALWGRLGMVLLAHNLYDEADQCFREAARLDSTSPRWPYGRALIALKLHPGDAPLYLKEAMDATDRARPEHQSAARLQLAEWYLEQEEWEQAEKLFQEEWRLLPGHPRAALGLGIAALVRNDPRAAEDYLRQAQASLLARKRATLQLAVLARRRNDLEAASRYDHSLASMPDDPGWPDLFRLEVDQLRVGHYGWQEKEIALEDQQRFAEAADLYLREAQANPTANAYSRAGYNLARAGDYEQAMKYLNQAVQLEPNSAFAHAYLAFTLFLRAEEQRKGAAISPQGREWYRASIEEARRATELQPSYGLAYLFWGLALKYLGEPAPAVVPLHRGIECAPESFELQLTLGEVLLEMRQYQEAETHLNNAHKLNPKDPRPQKALERLTHGRTGQGS